MAPRRNLVVSRKFDPRTKKTVTATGEVYNYNSFSLTPGQIKTFQVGTGRQANPTEYVDDDDDDDDDDGDDLVWEPLSRRLFFFSFSFFFSPVPEYVSLPAFDV